jgi:hypothetical protein
VSTGLKFTIAAGLLIVCGWAWTRHERKADEDALAVVASELAGRPVEVRCQGFWAELLDIAGRTGEVQFIDGRPGDSTYLTRRVCSELKAFRSADTHEELDCLTGLDPEVARLGECFRRVRRAAEAITTLAHEAMHLRGWSNEAQAQCYAIQGVGWTVVRLGGTAEQGVALGSLVLAQQPTLAPEYQSGECRAGGALDLVPSTEAFPAEDGIRLTPAGLYATRG